MTSLWKVPLPTTSGFTMLQRLRDDPRAHARDSRAARAARTMPFSPRELHGHTGMFPFMADWLKGGEGDRLLA